MERTLHELVQGSPEWHQFRAEHDGASEAAAMLGLSKYVSRSELLRQKATGIAEEVDAGKQRLFDAGHASEAAARAMAEGIIGEELYPATYSYGRMSASCDGLTMDGTIAWEHKLFNGSLAESVRRGELPDAYQPQCQQIMMVTGAEQVLFMVSDGTPESCAHTFVKPINDWRDRIFAGWAQFSADLATYTPPEVIPAAVAAPTMALPAVSIKVEGSVALISNLDIFGAGLKAFIARLPEKPSTDQEFADCKAACKTLQEAQDALDAAEAHAMGQVSSFDEMRRTKALYFDLARTTRLAVEKLVVAREQQIKVEIRQAGIDAFALHVAGLNTRIGKPYLSLSAPDFAGAMKGKRTIASLRDACDTLLAQSKIAANEVADRIQINLRVMDQLCDPILFPDISAVCLKAPDDFSALVAMRVSQQKAAEEKKEAETRDRIRKEEQDKLLREEEARKAKEHAAAQEQMPDTERKTTADMGNQSARGLDNAGNERPSGGLSLNSPAPAAAPSIQMVTIQKDEYERLLDDSYLLECLRAQGVDNWDGWDDAIDSFNDRDKAA